MTASVFPTLLSPACLVLLVSHIAVPAQVAADMAIPVAGFGSHIEGASIGPDGHFYATHFRNTSDDSSNGNGIGRNIIGQLDLSTGNASVYFVGEPAAVFNGMRWEASGSSVYLADVGQGKVVQVDVTTMTSFDFCGHADMRSSGVPNDLALSKTGLLYLSGQDWASSKGALWLCKSNGTNQGTALLLEGGMGRTNGIALSPDDKTLYVTEANGSPVDNASSAEGQRIWRYSVAADGSISNKTEFYNFALNPAVPEASTDSDGMRTDTAGNLYVTRNGLGKITVLTPSGKLMKELKLPSIVSVTNLAFGGAKGTSIYAVGRCGSSSWGAGDGCVDVVHSDTPGREWSWFQSPSQSTTTTVPQAPLSNAKTSVLGASATLFLIGIWRMQSL